MKPITTLAAAFALVSVTAANSQDAPTEPAGWLVEKKTNPIDDTAGEIFATGMGESYRGNPLAIVARCMANTTDILIIVSGIEFMPFNEYIAGNIQTKLRFDGNEAISVGGSASTDGNGYFLADAIPLIRQLAEAKKLAVEITTNKAQFISTFAVSDFRPIAQQIADACHWDLPPPAEAVQG